MSLTVIELTQDGEAHGWVKDVKEGSSGATLQCGCEAALLYILHHHMSPCSARLSSSGLGGPSLTTAAPRQPTASKRYFASPLHFTIVLQLRQARYVKDMSFIFKSV